jgi:thioredoxin reductase
VNCDYFYFFIKNITKKDDAYFELETSCNEVLKAKKILLACGAHAKIYHNFFRDLTGENKESKNDKKSCFRK